MSMVSRMNRRFITGFLTACLALATATAADMPDVEAAIPPPVAALGEPTLRDFSSGINMAVSSSSKEAQAHVNQGLNHLHGGWEFEASRHFAAAMRLDPDCLLAHWGMIMSLLNPSPETGPARNAATDRFLELVDQGQGTELERGYAYGLIKYIEEGPAGAASAFRKVAAKFPNEYQAGIFAALFSRGGFDPMGNPTVDQENAEAHLLEIATKHPGNPIALNALLFARADGPDLSQSLPLVRHLCQIWPDYPPFFHLLGHYEWRCGNHGAAASAFGRASSFYHKWMEKNEAVVADCPEWVKAECYRIVSVVSEGDFDTGYAASRRVADTPLPKDRPSSPGARFLMWDAKSLPARILIRRGLRGNAAEASSSLPKIEEVESFRKHSLAYWWLDGLRFALEAQRLIEKGNLREAREVITALTHHGERMSNTQKAAFASGERSPWLRSFRALEVLTSDLHGRLTLAGPAAKQGTAYNWFSSAADRQRPAPMLYPPLILSPMAKHLGDYFMAAEKPKEAAEAYQRALTAFPNDRPSLKALKAAYEAADMPAEATATGKQLKSLKVN